MSLVEMAYDKFQQNQPVFFFRFAHYAEIKISQFAVGRIFIAGESAKLAGCASAWKNPSMKYCLMASFIRYKAIWSESIFFRKLFMAVFAQNNIQNGNAI